MAILAVTMSACTPNKSAPRDAGPGGKDAGGATGVDRPVTMGGTGGTGGTGTTGATGGRASGDDGPPRTQDAGAVGNCLGSCVAMFFATCDRVGESCVKASSTTSSTTCYANGVKVASSQSGATITSTYYAPGGQECYQTIKQGLTQEDIQSPTGTELARIMFDETQTQLTITCYPDGPANPAQTATADLNAPNCAAYAAGISQSCTTGACSL